MAGSREAWSVDFGEFYAAGKLLGTGHLYNWPSIRALELQHSHRAVPFARIPAFALFFRPLSALPYSVARRIWLAIGFGALTGFVLLWPLPSRRWAIAALCWSVPVAMCLSFGQDSVLLLLFVAAGVQLLIRKRDFWAGLVFSLCAFKPHFVVLLPFVLAARGKWKALIGGVVGGATLGLLSFTAEGTDWPIHLLKLMRIPEFEPATDRMPNLRGVLSLFGGSLGLELITAAAVLAGCWIISRRFPWPRCTALALAGGLVLSPHAYGYDALLLLPALLVAFDGTHPLWTQAWALLVLTPVPYLLLLSDKELPGHLAVTGFTLALFALETYRARQAQTA